MPTYIDIPSLLFLLGKLTTGIVSFVFLFVYFSSLFTYPTHPFSSTSPLLLGISGYFSRVARFLAAAV